MMQKLSVALCFLTVLALLVGCSSTAHTGAADIRLDREASYFDDFTVQDETVLLRCVLQIENDGAEHEVTIKGFFPDDVGKLIDFSPLVGYPEAADPEGQTFLLRHGTNTVNVVFRGDYAGTPQKANRLLPEITIEPA